MRAFTDKSNPDNKVVLFHDVDTKVWKVRRTDWLAVAGEISIDAMSFPTPEDFVAECERRGFKLA